MKVCSDLYRKIGTLVIYKESKSATNWQNSTPIMILGNLGYSSCFKVVYNQFLSLGVHDHCIGNHRKRKYEKTEKNSFFVFYLFREKKCV